MRSYLFAAGLAALLVLLSYYYHFSYILGYRVSGETSVWSDFGGYVGGVLGAAFGFVSLVLLIKSIGLQYEANIQLREELTNTRKAEKVRVFESLFFGMIESQRELFGSFSLQQDSDNGPVSIQKGKAVVAIEDMIAVMKSSNCSRSVLNAAIEKIDEEDQLYGITRSFYITVETISGRLSEAEGFTQSDRLEYFKILINFLDFPHLRLIIINVQLTDSYPCDYLRSNSELLKVFDDVGLSFEIY